MSEPALIWRERKGDTYILVANKAVSWISFAINTCTKRPISHSLCKVQGIWERGEWKRKLCIGVGEKVKVRGGRYAPDTLKSSSSCFPSPSTVINRDGASSSSASMSFSLLWDFSIALARDGVPDEEWWDDELCDLPCGGERWGRKRKK